MSMVTTTSTKRAVAYRRVSTTEQAGERHSSLPTQEAHIYAYCNLHNLIPAAAFTDVASGRRDDRAQYRAMVKHVLEGGADVVVVQFLDRFGRNPREILRRVWELQESGVQVVATDEDIREELMLLIKAGIAGQESRRTGERVRASMLTAARNGTHFGRAPYGFRRVRVGGTVAFEQDEVETAAVREMVRLVIDENLGYKSIGDRLAASGVPSRNGRSWAAETVRKILSNEALIGTLTFNKKPRKGSPAGELVAQLGYFPPILSRDEWDALRARLTIRRENPRGPANASDYLLSGIARCGHCGGPMVGKRSYQRKDRAGNYRQYRNYWCSNAQRGRAKCAVYNGHSALKLEAAILTYLSQYDDPARVQALLADSQARSASSGADELVRVEKRLAVLDVDFQKNLDLLKRGILDEADFARANETRKSERRALQEREVELRTQITKVQARDTAAAALPARVRSFLDDVQNLETRKAKALLQTIVQAAHVYRDGRIELEFRA